MNAETASKQLIASGYKVVKVGRHWLLRDSLYEERLTGRELIRCAKFARYNNGKPNKRALKSGKAYRAATRDTIRKGKYDLFHSRRQLKYEDPWYW